MNDKHYRKVGVIDSHTAGEPTRVVVRGGPDLGNGPIAERLNRFRDQFDWFRSGVVNEPRGSDVTVGALLCEPEHPSSTAAVIFFNNAGYLGMCGHGTIGLLATLAHMGRVGPGAHRIETPVGFVTAVLHEGGDVTVNNVHCYRSAKDITLDVPDYGAVHGDVAWGGNWFFLVHDHALTIALENVEHLTDFAWRIRQSLQRDGITGSDGAEIDHIELYAPSVLPGVNSKNFVLCPGKAYDRSPCGTGTSAKLACLYADGEFFPGQVWRQESIVGTIFEGRIRVQNGEVHPSIKGRAFITAEAELVFDEHDPFLAGIPR